MKEVFSIKRIHAFTALLVFIYLVLRACMVPPVHDEAATYMHYIQRNEWMPFKAHWDANNHILNSFLGSIFFKIFGQHVWSLRLASLLFFPLYAFFVFKISAFLKNKKVQIGFLAGMLLIHNLIEYFAYARGYAMSMALLMGAIYFVVTYFKTFDVRKLWPFYVFSALALVANLTLFNTTLILHGIIFFSFFKNKTHWGLKGFYMILAIIPVIMVAYLSLEMKKLGLLYYGSNKGFYQVTVWSLVILIYDNWQPAIGIFFVILSVFSVLFLVLGGFGEKGFNWFFSNRWFFASLFLGNIVATFLLQLIMKVNYPEDRTAMYFYFFLVMFFCFSLDGLKNKSLHNLSLVWLVFPLHFMVNINLSHSSYWWYEHLPNTFYQEVKNKTGAHPEQVSVGGYVLTEMIWSYYNQQNGGYLNDLQTRDYPSFYYDYLILYDDNNNAFAQDYYNTLLVSRISGLRLMERKEKIQLTYITEITHEDLQNNTDEYVNFIENDSLKNYKNLCVDFSCQFQNKDPFFYGFITLGASLKGNGMTESQEFHFFRTEWNKGYEFHHRIYMENIPQSSDRVVLYFWNPRHQVINMKDIHIKLFRW